MSQLNTGTKPSKYALATRATLEAIAVERDELREEVYDRADCEASLSNMFIESDDKCKDLEKQNKTLTEELEIAREGLTVAYMHGVEKGRAENKKLREALKNLLPLAVEEGESTI